MSTTYYICKYTPVELLEAFGGKCAILNHMPDNFDLSDQVAHPNICGFGKSLLEACMEGKVKELVLVNCCDTIRSAYDVLLEYGKLHISDKAQLNGALGAALFALELE